MGMHVALKTEKFINTKRQVSLVPGVGFGPFELTAKSDEAAVHHVVREHVKPLIKAGAIKERVWALCGKAKVLVG